MPSIKPRASGAPPVIWDAAVAFLLGAALLAAGWLDTRAYLAHRGQTRPDFAFMEPPGGLRLGDVEAYRQKDTYVWLDHLGGLETSAAERFRHGLGPRSVIRIRSQHGHARLNLRYYNAIGGQDITVTCNGQVLEQFTGLPEGPIARSYPLTLQPGANEVALAFARYNHAGAELARADDRPMAGLFLALDLTLQ